MKQRKKSGLKLTAALLAVVCAGVLGTGYLIYAADHADSPNTDQSNLDINDLYVFSNGDNLVFAMTVSPLLTPGELTNNAALNPNGLYQFKIDNAADDGVEDAVIQVIVTGDGPTQTVEVNGPAEPVITGTDANELVAGASISGAFNTTFSGGGMTAFAGPRDDPFYIDLFGDMSLTSVLNAIFTAATGSMVGEADEQTLAFKEVGEDDLAGLNTLAIVVELPKSDVASALGITVDDPIYVWATSSAGRQVEIPSTGGGSF